ncbi:MAG: adenylate/guanylate cyclase domain-containing protein [Pseudomonadota bacterium]
MSAADTSASYYRARLISGLITALVIGILSGFLGELYGAIFYGEDDGTDYYQGFRTGFFIGIVAALIEIFYVRSVRRSWIRRVAFVPGLLVRILVMTLIVRVGLVGNEVLTAYLVSSEFQFETSSGEQIRDTLFSIAFVVIFVVLSQLSSIIGFKRFMNLVLGRYFRPVSEDRVFLFVDMVGSTRLARELGDVRFHELLSEFFYQIDRAIVQTGGEVVSYVGDAVIVTWPLGSDSVRNGKCLRALQIMHAHIGRQRGMFEREFGVQPKFRAAMHGGPVVVGECGDRRRQVTFLGDAVNMTARIEAKTKELQQDFLISDELLQRLRVPDGMIVEPEGDVELEGADANFVLHRVKIEEQKPRRKKIAQLVQ